MPSSRVFAFSDPYEYQAAIRAGTVEVIPATGGTFKAELTRIDLQQLWLQGVSESLPRLINGPVDSNRAGIEFPVGTDGSTLRHRGIDVARGEIVVDDLEPTPRRSFGPSGWAAMSLAPAALAAAGLALVGRELTRPSVMRIVRPPRALMERLLNRHAEATQLAKTRPERLTHPEVAGALEEGLIHLMVRCLTEGAMTEMDTRARSHAAVISKLEEFLSANRTQAIYVSEICAVAGASESTLRRCGQEQLGMGSVRYLWLRRMHLTRLALMRADPAATTVTEVATDHGFWELGRFSVE